MPGELHARFFLTVLAYPVVSWQVYFVILTWKVLSGSNCWLHWKSDWYYVLYPLMQQTENLRDAARTCLISLNFLSKSAQHKFVRNNDNEP